MRRLRVVMLALCGAMAVAVVLAQAPQKRGDYPQVWYQTPGKGRTFHAAIGHREDLWRIDATCRQCVIGAIRWAPRLEE